MTLSKRPRPMLALAAIGFALATTGGLAQGAASQQTTNVPASAAALPPYTYDAQMKQVLTFYSSIAGKPITALNPQDARQQFSAEDAAKAVARIKGLQEAPEPVGSVKEQMIAGPGGPIKIRIYTPGGAGPFPVLMYYHGGGFVIATIDTYDASARALTNLAHATVISVEYRKAPEHPFPSAIDDAFTAYKWALTNAASIHGDANRVAVAGESAGGNLATEVCIIARDRGLRMPVYQLLVYPLTQYSLTTYSDKAYYNAVPLSTPALQWFYRYYLRSAADATNPMAAPLSANVKGLPPATIIAAEIDPLQSDGRQYALKLKNAGVPVKYRFYAGVTHEFFGMGAVVAKARQAESDAAADLRAAFHE